MAKTHSKKVKSSVYRIDRKIPEWTRILLYTRAGGRCEFDGCQRYLLRHHVNFQSGNFAELAHVVAFSKDGPRGYERRPKDIHDVENLMLLCPTCHKLIDRQPKKFPRKTLESYKQTHERQIFHLTGLRPELKTAVLVVKSKIGGYVANIPQDQILGAVAPRYPISQNPFTIDLTQLDDQAPGFSTTARASIVSELNTFFGNNGEAKKTGHVSVFALATMPVLVALGSALSNKVPTSLYQSHRDNDSWTWQQKGKRITYRFKRLVKGRDPKKVALILSLSGRRRPSELPIEIDRAYTVYEITLVGTSPKPTFLKTRQALTAFKEIYHEALATIMRDRPGLKAVHLFPVVPAPIAVLCGRELLPRAHPALKVYDWDKTNGGFRYELTVNT